VADGALATRYRATPWWARVLVIFIASRVVTTAILLYFAAIQAKNPWTDAAPGYAQYSRIWDGHWYYIISVAGYPSVLPLTPDGHVGESAWAFMPAFPAIAGLFRGTGLDFGVVATGLSVSFALGAALLFYRLLVRFIDESAALFAVVLFCVAPLSPILQLAYAESMGLFFLVLALWLLVSRHYWVLIPVVAVMSLTRPSGLAFALALALHVAYRWRRRRDEPFPAAEALAAVVATIAAGVSGLAWLLVAWAVTGSLTAYTDTELAWRSAYIGYQDLVPFTPWWHAAQFWLRFPLGWLIVGITAIAIVGFAVLLRSRAGRRLGVDLRFWLVSYSLYLLAVFFPQSSTFRLLMPLFPALGIVAQPRHPLYRVAVVLLCIAGQIAWVQIAWYVDGADWTPP
jgi:hypothetical protein